jgi:hypothetical protein
MKYETQKKQKNFLFDSVPLWCEIFLGHYED